MPLLPNLLEKLACPVCHGKMEYDGKNDKLTCLKDKLAFRVKDDIPMLNLDEAEKLD